MRISLTVFVFYSLAMLAACSDRNDIVDLGTAASCDVAVAPCDFHSGVYNMKLVLGPEVRPLQPFKVELQIRGGSIEPQSVVVDFIMIGMDMGFNRYRLSAGNGNWTGKATLPVCVASRTDWLASVEFSDAGKQYIAAFPFHTDVN